ncbi:MAG: hypothetical protein KDC73_10775 [Ignavibacteriae bacterium]|nr:hypothetical protein [Ignavibacteriota bacterium]MCB9242502.1 hypothetical protein [Ignavibacteriales bacterium]
MSTCIKWGEERQHECVATEDQGYSECAASEDQGYNKCAATADQGYKKCCTWKPCSWLCSAWVWVSNIVCVAWTWVSNIVCIAWTWVSNIVCIAWTWITTSICVLWDIGTSAINAVIVTLESVLGWVLSAIGFVIELIESIPVIGTIIKYIFNFISTVVSVVFSIGDTILGAIGIRPEKILRVCTIILRDENGNLVSSTEVAKQLLQVACDIYKRDCNVRVIPSKPFQYFSGFSEAETVSDDWIILDSNSSDSDILDVRCDSFNSAFGTPTSSFQLKSSILCFFGSWRRILGYGAPVTCFIIRNIPDAIGCHIAFTDYATIEGSFIFPYSSPRTLGHEVGHACMLPHSCVNNDNSNMMATQDQCNPFSTIPPDRVNPRINNIQALAIRASKHVTYF